MIDQISAYFLFSKTVIKEEYFAYKYKFIFWSLSNVITLLVQIFLWIAVYKSTNDESINGYLMIDMLNYVIFSKIIESMTFVSVESKVSDDFRSGNIALNLSKPINYEYELLFRSLGGILGSIIMFVPLYFCISLIVNIIHSAMPLTLSGLMFSFILCIFSISFNFFLSMIFSAFIFKTVFYSGVNELKKMILKILSGAFFPLEFYPEVFRKILDFLPFSYLRYYPIAAMQGKISLQHDLKILIIGIIWFFFLFFIYKLIWNKLYKKISIYGG